MAKRFRNPEMVEAYNVAGFRERYVMENGNKSTVYLNGHKCYKFTYSKDVDYQDAKCPSCGNDDNTTMDIAFRVCGYIGTAKNGGNQGRYGDIHDRVYHLDDFECVEDK